jgi:hypothetical protein
VCEDVDWIDLAQDRDQWWALVIRIMDSKFPLALLIVPVQLRRCIKNAHSKSIRLFLLFESYMFRPNWPSSSVKVKVAGETTAYNKIITA